MYNPDQKIKFIRSYTRNIKRAAVAEKIFKSTAEQESLWGEDICHRSVEEIRHIADQKAGECELTANEFLLIISSYIKWCYVNKLIRGGKSTLTSLKASGRGANYNAGGMVAGPRHLQCCLDAIFDAEDEETVDNAYRCFLWLVYGGMKARDAIVITADNISLDRMEVFYNNISYPIYREAVPSLLNCMRMSEFKYKHPLYTEISSRKRSPGNSLVRTLAKATGDQERILLIRDHIKKSVNAALREDRLSSRINIASVHKSGIFYRYFEEETITGSVKIEERHLRRKYEEWKLEFFH